MPLDTIEDISRYAKSLCMSDVSIPLCAEWVNFRIAEVAGQKQLRFYRRLNELSTPAIYNTGTIAATRGSAIITGTGTTWTSAYNDWFFRTKTAWYRVLDASLTALTLESAYAEDDTTGASYVLVKHQHELPSDVHTFHNSLTHARTGQPVYSTSLEESMALYPGRFFSQGGLPKHFWEVEPSVSGQRQIEIYPYPSHTELYYYLCWLKPEPLDLLSPVPSFVNAHILVEGVKADLLFYEALHTREATRMAALLNEHRRQVTYWSGKIQEALLSEKGLDDSQFLVQSLADRRNDYDRRIMTARDDIWSRS